VKVLRLREPWSVILIALLLVVVILILGNQWFKSTEKATFDEFNQRQLVLATEATSGIELYFETLAGSMRALGRIAEVQHLVEAPTRRELQHRFEELEPLGVNDIGVLDADGRLRYNAAAPEIEGVDFSWREYYQEAKELGSTDSYIIEFIEFKGVEAGQEGVLVAVPMFVTPTDSTYAVSPSRFAGVILCTLKLDTITQKFVAPIKSSERGHAFMIGDEHTVLWAPDSSLFGRNLLEASEGFPAFQQSVERMAAGNSGTAEYSYHKVDATTGEYHGDETEEHLLAYAPIHLGNELWSIGVWAPKEDARQVIRSAYLGQLLVVGLSVFVILLGSAYALVTSFRTSRSLEKEVEAKTGELRGSHGRLLAAMGSLEAAHAFQQAIIDGVADSVMVIGADYRIQLMNRVARESSDGDSDITNPLFCYQLSHHREAPCRGTEHPCPLEQVRASRQPVKVMHEHYQLNGERRFVELVASPLWGADGSFQGIIESTRDITERMQAQAALQQQAERLRALTARLGEVADAERQRLARELHDQVGQNLTALGINLNIVRTQIPEGLAAPVHSRLDDSLSLVEQTTERVRDVMANLRPPMLDDYGLVAALHWYGERFARRTDIAVAVDGDEPVPRLAKRVENALFLIAQEALTNVAKHAQATQVAVTVKANGDALRLVILDNGIGFDPERLAVPDGGPGWGLLTMTERAEAVGGRCRIESAPGQGTHVIVEVAR
jgi:signal transduction histidine kinase